MVRLHSWTLVSLLAMTAAGACAEGGARTSDYLIVKQEVAGGLEHPWALAALPDGRLLVTERPGRLRYVGADGALSEPITGLPEVWAEGQGGLLDVVLDPAFASNGLIYLSYAEEGEGGAGTAVARGRLAGQRLEDVRVIFRQAPKVDEGANHFGGRLVFAADGTLFVTLGERYTFAPAQDNETHLGAVVRINPDGSIPASNPFVGRAGADEVWSYGHRNILAGAIHPQTGALWIAEMGPAGGDELNIPEAGRNYGWPLVSWGNDYDGADIPDPPTRPEFADAVRHWTPVIAPSGMLFYDGRDFPAWRGDVLIGGLASEGLVRLDLDESGAIAGEERISLDQRIRDVELGVDGALYVVTEEGDGEVLRLVPRAGS